MLAALVAAAAAWLSSGTIALDATAAVRIGLLPRDPMHLAVAALIGFVVLAIGLRGERGRGVTIAVSPLVLLFLPWLPLRVPAALLIWSGGLESLVWIAAVIALAAVAVGDLPYVAISVPPRTQACIAAALSFTVFSLAAWCASPVIPAGDEPHYLIITQSLLRDGDIQIENNHRRGDYREYSAVDLRPDFIRPGRNGAIYSIHAPGLPALILPAFAIAGYRGVVVFLIMVASAVSGLAWWLAWRVTHSRSGAWFGWAAVALSGPYLLETFTVYPDGAGAAVVLTGFWALLRADWDRATQGVAWRPWLLHGAALATLPWIHTRFSVLAATLGGLALIRLTRTPNAVAKAIALLAAPGLSAIAWLWFFLYVYGTPDPSAPYAGQMQNSFAFFPDGFGGLLFDQGFGLVASAPVLILAFGGFFRERRFAAAWFIVATPYLLTVTTFAMWWAGWSAPARFFVPVLLPLAVPTASAWLMIRSRGLRAYALALLVISAWMALVLAAGGGGHLGYHARNEAGMTPAPWLKWAAHVVDLTAAVPAFVPLPVGSGLAARQAAARSGLIIVLPWIVCGGAAAFALHAFARRRLRHHVGLVATTTIIFAVAATVAVSAGWRLQRDDSVATERGQIEALAAAARTEILAVDLTGRRRLTIDELVSRMRIEVHVVPTSRPGSRVNRPLVTLSGIPAGDYRLTVHQHGADGWIMACVGADRDPFALLTEPIANMTEASVLRFPVDVRSLLVRGDEDAARHVDAVVLQPLRILQSDSKPAAGFARRAVRYTGMTAFFMDDRAFPEPNAFWIGGARESDVVLLPDHPRSSQPLLLRNAPVDNVVTLSSGSWREELRMTAEEERRVEVPIDPAHEGVLLRMRSAGGFRPSAADPGSRDTRFLGVYVRVP
ncbi:MAG: hypothetical protein DMF84_07090 [Acidobacteria bacterium]|nr:MAG: hypothetical protein DMF84_07090 [Acidobacteriota bacterium]